MLFHVTITHPWEACPGLRPDQTPELIGPSEKLDARAAELGVTRHLLLWGAGCILWAEAEHVAYALIEAASREAALEYIASATPSSWSARALPVWNVPEQLAIVRQLLSTPAITRAAPPLTSSGAVPEPAETAASASPSPESSETPIPSSARATASGRPTARASITELLDELDDQQQTPNSAAGAEHAGLSLLKGETMILESVGSLVPALRLLATAGPCEGSIFEVGESGAVVGRLAENPIYVPDGRLSRKHARIDYRDGLYWLTDLGSANGTMLNSRPLTTPMQLHVGDVVELGESRFSVQIESESRTPTD